MSLTLRPRDVRRSLEDPLVGNAAVILLTTALMAVAGSLFWVVAARLASTAQVGLAGSLVSATVTLSYLAQLGLNITMVRVLQRSQRPAADVAAASVLVSGAGLVLGLGYVLLLPVVSPRLSTVLDDGWTALAFGVLVAATAVNLLTDSVFLAVRRVRTNLWINGGLMGALKVGLPFLLAGVGAFGLFGAVGLASLVAGVTGLVALLRVLPGGVSLRPSGELLGARRFAGAGYATSVLDLLPQLVLPVLVLNASGASASGVYFVSFQIVVFLNSVVYAVGASMYAEGEAAAPHDVRRVVRKAAVVLGGAVALGVAVLEPVAPWVLHVFGPQYAADGATTLRVLALGSLGVAFNYWSAIRLRLAHHLRAMVGVQLTTTTVMVGLAVTFADRGPVWVAAAWGLGQLGGGLLGYAVSHLVAPLPSEEPPAPTDEPILEEAVR